MSDDDRRIVILSQAQDGSKYPLDIVHVSEEMSIRTGPTLVEAPANMTDDDIRQCVFVGGQWIRRQRQRKLGDPFPYELFWAGVIGGKSGYAKANREILLRLANTVRIQVGPDVFPRHPGSDLDPYDYARIHPLCDVSVNPGAPMLRFHPPITEHVARYSICWTMMETQTLHPDMRDKLNENYHECWVPTRWNQGLFKDNGVVIPIYVMPLGVNTHLYRHDAPGDLPEMRLLTTHHAGTMEVPSGFRVLTVGTPTFRKNYELTALAFAKAFEGQKDCALIVATTWQADFDEILSGIAKLHPRCRIYALEGGLSEHGMAALYRHCHVYISTSHGEGWDLPLCEAAACGLPVIASATTAHLDLCSNENSFIVEPEGKAPFFGSKKVSGWFEDQEFSTFGQKSLDQCVEHLRFIRDHYDEARNKAYRLRSMIECQYTWEHAAEHVLDRLMQISGGCR